MRARRIIAIVVPMLVLMSCTRTSSRSVHPYLAQALRSDVVVLGTRDGIAALDVRSGRMTSLISGAIPEPDWSHVYTTTSSAGETTITRIETATGDPVSTSTVRGSLQIRAVAPSGLGVALMPQAATNGQGAWVPRSRARTHIVVADPVGASPPQRFDLKGTTSRRLSHPMASGFTCCSTDRRSPPRRTG